VTRQTRQLLAGKILTKTCEILRVFGQAPRGDRSRTLEYSFIAVVITRGFDCFSRLVKLGEVKAKGQGLLPKPHAEDVQK
jgi:hypothetical protein